MRPHLSALLGRVGSGTRVIAPSAASLVASLFAAGALVSCTDGTPTGTGGVDRVELSAPSTQLRPGFLMRASVSVLDRDGSVVNGRTVVWRSLTPATLAVDGDGLLRALAPGLGIARASVGPVSAELRLDLVNPPISTLRLDVDTLRLSLPGGTRILLAEALDANGIQIVRPDLRWSSDASRLASVTITGQVNGVAVGRTRVTVSGDGREAVAEVIVSATPSPTSPIITGLAPALAIPGQQLIVNGNGFGGTVNSNAVVIDGVPVAIISASPTQLVLSLPPATSFACEPARVVSLQVTMIGGIGVSPVMLQVATTRTLGVGQSLILASANEARCVELSAGAGRYVITVPNAARTLGAGPAAFSMRGVVSSGATGSSGPMNVRTDIESAARGLGAIRDRVDDQDILRRRTRESGREREHANLLETNRQTVERARSFAPSIRMPTEPARLVPAPGDVLPVRIPNIGQPNICDSFLPIGGRTVYVGSRVIILEDTSSSFNGQPTLARQMDGTYAAIGNEFESTVWPLSQTFGNPLAMDGRLDDNGRIVLVFTPRMNVKQSGAILAATVNCDFFSRALFPASNAGEYIYAQVPTTLASGFGTGTRARWLHEMRSTIAHEMKHVTSFGERIVRGQPLEESWLEEATARHAEELYGRAVLGTLRNGNAGFASIACEFRSGDSGYPECLNTPRVMRPHFDALWSYLDAPMVRSPLGPISPDDFSFYGSGWALTRWILDQEGISEQSFFTALSTSGQAGLANLEARTGRSWDEMLGEWSLALATDDLGGFVSASPRLRFPSWDLRSVFQGYCDVVGPCLDPFAPALFPRAWPLQPIALAAGAFTLDIPALTPGGFVPIELNGSAAFRQLIELKGLGGAALPSTLRLAIVRVQ